MKQDDGGASPAGRAMPFKRKAVRLAQDEMVKRSYLQRGETFPLVLSPDIEDFNLVSWAGANKEFIEAELLKHGAILFRGFKVDSVIQFEQFARAISSDLLEYRERAAPRTEVGR